MAGASLASVQQLAAYLQQPLEDTDASALLYLQIASGMICDYLEQQLVLVADDAYVADPINGAYVFLPELPVGAVSLVETYDDTVTPGVWSTADPSTYTVSTALGIVAGKPCYGVQWPTDPGTWRVTYTHGFSVIPDALMGVACGVAARAYVTQDGIDSERIGGYQVKYDIQADGFSPIELKALGRYIVPRVA